ncbi:conserved hypothetical protein [delta proteobacterium NaphS2]|nr:conserved hypothetical protein [delta proteobacterium NaphS2]
MVPDIAEAFQIVKGRKSHNFPRRVVFQVPEIDLQSVGINAKRQLVPFVFTNVVTVLLSLFTAQGGVFTGLFCFDHCQRFRVAP